ncbi:uncharacterized protein PAC_16452 [Phialocephala subalpina]|uniref:Chitin-binding type-1 domain-containing protein n=1 Tax=Phialocephala subalpina TaxID=576137 RepID=A0A1L7XNB1_9HELO|nr:uncharacterized protein PAC_16452 [Phialocephala subalpina]
MQYMILLIALVAMTPSTLAYQTMRIPTPLRYTFNAFIGNSTPDNYTEPLTADQFPCKGYLADMTSGIAQSVTTYQAGKPAWIILTGDSISGSTQISMSGNNGSLTVIHSYEGNVSIKDQQQLDFTFPSGSPTGPVVLSFTYFPLGSNEVYQSCAAVTILPAEANATAPRVTFASRPDIFVSDLNNSCTRDPKKEVMFPNAGPDTTMMHSVPMANEIDTIFGDCQPVNGFGNGAKANSSNTIISFPFPTAASKAGPGPRPSGYKRNAFGFPGSFNFTHPGNATMTTSAPHTIYPTGTGAPRYTTHTPGSHPHPTGTPAILDIPVSIDGTCGAKKATRCPAGLCCSMYGNCGTGANYCGNFTCEVGFGDCSKFDNGTFPNAPGELVRYE